MNNFVETYLKEIKESCSLLDKDMINQIVSKLKKVKENSGRIFFIGVGGGAGNATHAVNDFRKIADIECYTPSDNISELTARINDDGWSTSYKEWLLTSKLSKNDIIFAQKMTLKTQHTMVILAKTRFETWADIPPLRLHSPIHPRRLAAGQKEVGGCFATK